MCLVLFYACGSLYYLYLSAIRLYRSFTFIPMVFSIRQLTRSLVLFDAYGSIHHFIKEHQYITFIAVGCLIRHSSRSLSLFYAFRFIT